MKILKLSAENIKRLVAVEIVPDGEIVTIAGRNSSGKTSVLDSIWWALAGAGVIQGDPIRKGQDKARIRLELGEGREVELIAERKFRRGKSELTFTNADGSPTKLPPQAMADSLIGALSFDPLAFSRKKSREMYDELRRIANLEVDIEELDRQNAADYAKRTDVNREAKAKAAAAEQLSIGEVIPQKVDTRAILDEIEGAAQTNKKLAERREKRRTFEKSIEELATKAEDLQSRAIRMRNEAAALEREAVELAADVRERRLIAAGADPVPEPVDVSDLRKRLDEATEDNRSIGIAEAAEAQRGELLVEVEELQKASEALTAAMEKRDVTKREAIQGAQLPVEGLGFGDGIVTYNGLPFDQAGTAERWRVCVAIAMAQNPRLRVIRIDEGSLLDSEAMAILAEMARENDWQCWVEVVDESGEQGFVIEDGALKEG